VIPKSRGVDTLFDELEDRVKEAKEGVETYVKGLASKVKGAKLWKDQIEVPYAVTPPREWELTSQKKGFRRFTNAEFKSLLARHERAEEDREARLAEILKNLMGEFAKSAKVWLRAVDASAQLDVLCSLSLHARAGPNGGQDDMCQPKFLAEDEPPCFRAKGLCLHAGFVPNNVSLGGVGAGGEREKVFALVTGPNMGGKSTLMRQVALAALLGQIGAHVPAASVTLTPCDGFYVRMGARDNIMTGQSTFQVELEETAAVLELATEKSFVAMDEFGRGTSTTDGIALAAGVMRKLKELGCRCLFSTHYHALVEEGMEGDECLHMECEENEEGVTFLYKLKQGVCKSSFGVNVARLAGIPQKVLERASELINQ